MYALCFRLLRKDDLHELIARHRKKLEWVTTAMFGEELVRDLLLPILDFDAKYGKTPKPKDLIDFTSTSDNKYYSVAAVEMEIEKFKDIDEAELQLKMDGDVLVDLAVKEVRQLFHLNIMRRYGTILLSAPQSNGNKSKKKELCGINDAMAFVREQWTHDLADEAPIPAGMLHENVHQVAGQLNEYLNSNDEDRLYTLFPAIDEKCVIRRGKFLGIVGGSGDGKTLFLNTLVYNFARQGKNVLHIPLEFSPKEMWEAFAFLHCSYFSKKYPNMPSRHDWEMKNVTPKQVQQMREVIQDIRSRTSLPGLIDFQQLRTWDDTVAYLEANNKKNSYDVVVIDYFSESTFEVEGRNQQERESAVNAIISKAIKLAHSFDGGRGITVVSPAQITKEAKKLAKDREEGRGAYSIDSIHTYKSMRFDADLLFGVYADEDMKFNWTSEVNCIKWRGTEFFGPFSTTINPNSKHVRQQGDAANEKEIAFDDRISVFDPEL
jgi:hypothetical protein